MALPLVLIVALAPGPVAADGPPAPRPPQPGPVCDADSLVGVALPAISGPDGCGVAAPLEISFVEGVALEPPAVLSCGAARALRAWLASAVKPAVAASGARLATLSIAGAYVCRGRNGQAGAKLSEHGLGRAIDVAALRFADGSEVEVGSAAPALVARIRAAACGPFATVLGPGSDSFHETHLHLDVADRQHGPYCR